MSRPSKADSVWHNGRQMKIYDDYKKHHYIIKVEILRLVIVIFLNLTRFIMEELEQVRLWYSP
jgi:hypothetical protein